MDTTAATTSAVTLASASTSSPVQTSTPTIVGQNSEMGRMQRVSNSQFEQSPVAQMSLSGPSYYNHPYQQQQQWQQDGAMQAAYEQTSNFYDPSPSLYVGSLPLGLLDGPPIGSIGMASAAFRPWTSPASMSPNPQSVGILQWNQPFMSSHSMQDVAQHSTQLTGPSASASGADSQSERATGAESIEQPFRPPSTLFAAPLQQREGPSFASFASPSSALSHINALGLSWQAEHFYPAGAETMATAPIPPRPSSTSSAPAMALTSPPMPTLFEQGYGTYDHSLLALSPTAATPDQQTLDSGSVLSGIANREASQSSTSHLSRQATFPISLANSNIFRRRSSLPVFSTVSTATQKATPAVDPTQEEPTSLVHPQSDNTSP